LDTREGRVSDSKLELLKAIALDEIYILGGEQSVNASVVKQLKETTGVRVTRIAGSNRYVANANAVEANYKEAKHVVIASGEVYSDALYGVSYANTVNSPVVLTRTNRLDASTINLFKELNVESVTIIGGPVTVSSAVESQLKELGIKHNRIAGKNRYAGSAEVASASYKNPENVVIASGEVFSDALVSAPLAQKLNAPILLVRKDRMENVVEDYLRQSQLALKNIYIQGGPITVYSETETRIKGLTTYSIESTVLPFETIEEEDDTLIVGEKEVVQLGEDGFEEVFYNVTKNSKGEEVSREEFHRDTVDSTPKIVKVGTRVDIDEITLTPSSLILEEGESYVLTAKILPGNATTKTLVWTSSDQEVITIDENGLISAHTAGESTITVSNITGEITDQIVVTVREPIIVRIDSLEQTLTQHEAYTLPTSVTAFMSNGTTRELPVAWEQTAIDTSIIGAVEINGIVGGFEETIKLSVIVEEYNPKITTHSYSSVTRNNVSQQLSLNMYNAGKKAITIDRIEIYERGKLFTTYTSEDLEESDIPTTVNPNGSWGISIQYKIGLWLDGSYVKYYVTVNDTTYEYEESLERN